MPESGAVAAPNRMRSAVDCNLTLPLDNSAAAIVHPPMVPEPAVISPVIVSALPSQWMKSVAGLPALNS